MVTIRVNICPRQAPFRESAVGKTIYALRALQVFTKIRSNNSIDVRKKNKIEDVIRNFEKHSLLESDVCFFLKNGKCFGVT